MSPRRRRGCGEPRKSWAGSGLRERSRSRRADELSPNRDDRDVYQSVSTIVCSHLAIYCHPIYHAIR